MAPKSKAPPANAAPPAGPPLTSAPNFQDKFNAVIKSGNFEDEIGKAHVFVKGFVPETPRGKRAATRVWGDVLREVQGLGVTAWVLPCPNGLVVSLRHEYHLFGRFLLVAQSFV